MTQHDASSDHNPNSTIRIKTATERAREEALAKIEENVGGKSPINKNPALRTQVERRITEQLILHWQLCRKEKDFPSLEAIDIPTIEPLWEDCILIRITNDATQSAYHFEHIGKNILGITGEPQPNEENFIPFATEYLGSKYHFITEMRRPHVEESELYDKQDRLIKYRQILLPIGHDDTLTHIFIGIRYKIFDESE